MAVESPVVLDGLLTDEKISDLLALATEYPELDFKQEIDLSTKEGKVFLARHVGAMQVRGGYILIGVDQKGVPTGDMDDADDRLFDSANLKPMLSKYLPTSITILSRVLSRPASKGKKSHKIVAIYVGPHPSGFAAFKADGAYLNGKNKQECDFLKGDIFWRDGTSSVKLSHEGVEEVIARRVLQAKQEWMDEQADIRRQERADLTSARRGREAVEGPLGSIDLDLDSKELSLAALELLRQHDEVALKHLLLTAESRARELIDRDELDGLGDLLDKLTCLAATFMQYEVPFWFTKTIQSLSRIYGMPITVEEARFYGQETNIDPSEVPPRVWIAIIERVVALGGLAVRKREWDAVKELALQLPETIGASDYNRNWLRHGLTMASRANQFNRDGENQLSLLTLARNQAVKNDCLRIDGIGEDDEKLLTSLAQFDFLSAVVALNNEPGVRPGQVFYPSFSRFRQGRIQEIADALISDQSMKEALTSHGDTQLAKDLQSISNAARTEGWRYDGFDDFDGTKVGTFINENLPSDDPV